MKRLRLIIGMLFLFALLTLGACGTKVGTGLTGNVTLKSQAFNPAATALLLSAISLPVSDFKFCLTKLKLEAADGSTVQKDGASELEFKAGLIDVSDGQAKTWATANLPTGFRLGKVRVELHHDPETCVGFDYSVQFNGVQTTDDVEFRFKFAPPVDLLPGDALQLSLSTIVSALRTAADGGQLTNETLKTYAEGVEDDGSK